MPFKIQRAGPDSMQLPTAHTCFNTLILRTFMSDCLIDSVVRVASLLVSHLFSFFLVFSYTADYGSDNEKLERLLGRAILECEGFGLQ
jgi:HECT-domain (ubiquitin-transferase)